MKKYLLTGGTGFLGSRLALELIKNGDAVIFLGRPADGISLQTRVRNVLHTLDHKINLDNLVTIETDIAKNHLGLSQEFIQSLHGQIDGIWHLAANLSFKESDRDIVHNTNVEGVRKILDLAKKLRSPLYYISTSYVHGNRPGPIFEDELIYPRRGFNNYYEKSKYLSEGLIREYAEKNSIDFIIFRPSILIDTGENIGIKKFGYYGVVAGFYDFRKNLVRIAQKGSILLNVLGIRMKERKLCVLMPFPYPPYTYLNLIPVDWAVSWMISISSDIRAKGRTFHIVNPHPFLIKTLLGQVLIALDIKMPILKSPKWIVNLYFAVLIVASRFIKPLKSMGSKLYYYKYYIV